MKSIRWSILLLALALGGCAAMVKVEKGQVTIRDALTVTTSAAWNRLDAAGLYLFVAPGANEVWTVDGITLDVVAFFVGVADGDTLGTELPRTGKKLTPFRASMSPHEIVELYEALTTQEGSAFKLTRLAPVRFGGAQGFRFEYRMTRKGDGLALSGVGFAAVAAGKLYLMAYTAPTTHFFARHLAGVESVAASARISAK